METLGNVESIKQHFELLDAEEETELRQLVLDVQEKHRSISAMRNRDQLIHGKQPLSSWFTDGETKFVPLDLGEGFNYMWTTTCVDNFPKSPTNNKCAYTLDESVQILNTSTVGKTESEQMPSDDYSIQSVVATRANDFTAISQNEDLQNIYFSNNRLVGAFGNQCNRKGLTLETNSKLFAGDDACQAIPFSNDLRGSEFLATRHNWKPLENPIDEQQNTSYVSLNNLFEKHNIKSSSATNAASKSTKAYKTSELKKIYITDDILAVANNNQSPRTVLSTELIPNSFTTDDASQAIPFSKDHKNFEFLINGHNLKQLRESTDGDQSSGLMPFNNHFETCSNIHPFATAAANKTVELKNIYINDNALAVTNSNQSIRKVQSIEHNPNRFSRDDTCQAIQFSKDQINSELLITDQYWKQPGKPSGEDQGNGLLPGNNYLDKYKSSSCFLTNGAIEFPEAIKTGEMKSIYFADNAFADAHNNDSIRTLFSSEPDLKRFKRDDSCQAIQFSKDHTHSEFLTNGHNWMQLRKPIDGDQNTGLVTFNQHLESCNNINHFATTAASKTVDLKNMHITDYTLPGEYSNQSVTTMLPCERNSNLFTRDYACQAKTFSKDHTNSEFLITGHNWMQLGKPSGEDRSTSLMSFNSHLENYNGVSSTIAWTTEKEAGQLQTLVTFDSQLYRENVGSNNNSLLETSVTYPSQDDYTMIWHEFAEVVSIFKYCIGHFRSSAGRSTVGLITTGNAIVQFPFTWVWGGSNFSIKNIDPNQEIFHFREEIFYNPVVVSIETDNFIVVARSDMMYSQPSLTISRKRNPNKRKPVKSQELQTIPKPICFNTFEAWTTTESEGTFSMQDA